VFNSFFIFAFVFKRVSELKQVLQQATSIPIDDQILLMNSIKLENKATLRSQGLPDVNKQVFLFDRQLLKPNSPPPPQMTQPTIQTFEMKGIFLKKFHFHSR